MDWWSSFLYKFNVTNICGISSLFTLQSKFVIDVYNPIIRNYLLDKLAMRFENFHHQLKKEFEQYPTVEEAKRNPPKDLRHKQAEWESLCDYFSSEAFKVQF